MQVELGEVKIPLVNKSSPSNCLRLCPPFPVYPRASNPLPLCPVFPPHPHAFVSCSHNLSVVLQQNEHPENEPGSPKRDWVVHCIRGADIPMSHQSWRFLKSNKATMAIFIFHRPSPCYKHLLLEQLTSMPVRSSRSSHWSEAAFSHNRFQP